MMKKNLLQSRQKKWMMMDFVFKRNFTFFGKDTNNWWTLKIEKTDLLLFRTRFKSLTYCYCQLFVSVVLEICYPPLSDSDVVEEGFFFLTSGAEIVSECPGLTFFLD